MATVLVSLSVSGAFGIWGGPNGDQSCMDPFGSINRQPKPFESSDMAPPPPKKESKKGRPFSQELRTLEQRVESGPIAVTITPVNFGTAWQSLNKAFKKNGFPMPPGSLDSNIRVGVNQNNFPKFKEIVRSGSHVENLQFDTLGGAPQEAKPEKGKKTYFIRKPAVKGKKTTRKTVEQPSPTQGKLSQKEYDRVVDKIKNVDALEDEQAFGNGGIGSKEYDPKKWRQTNAVKELEDGLKGYYHRGVEFETVTDFDGAIQKLREHAENSPETLKILEKYLRRLHEKGHLQALNYSGVSGGPAVGYSYFSNPQYFDAWIVGPDGKGVNISWMFENGD